MSSLPTYLRTGRVARILGISPQRVLGLVHDGVLPFSAATDEDEGKKAEHLFTWDDLMPYEAIRARRRIYHERSRRRHPRQLPLMNGMG